MPSEDLKLLHTDQQASRRSTRPKFPTLVGLESAANIAINFCFSASLPINDKEAISNPNWMGAMRNEFESLRKLEVFDIVARPDTTKVIGGRWVFNRKSSLSGKDTFKARYVAKGFQQTYGVSYTDTWSPTISSRNIRLLFALAAALGLRVGHLDVKTAFLNAKLKETNIFIELPNGYKDGKNVMHLKKALYGLNKQGKNGTRRSIAQ